MSAFRGYHPNLNCVFKKQGKYAICTRTSSVVRFLKIWHFLLLIFFSILKIEANMQFVPEPQV